MNMNKGYHVLRLALCRDGYKRAEYIRRHRLFGLMGEKCYFHPWWMPADPERIYIHNNVKIASNVTFINHDILDALFRDGQFPGGGITTILSER